MNLIKSSYDSGYGVTDDGYGKGTPYAYASNYRACVQTDNGNNGKGKGNRGGLSNLAGLLGGCNKLGGGY